MTILNAIISLGMYLGILVLFVFIAVRSLGDVVICADKQSDSPKYSIHYVMARKFQFASPFRESLT